MVLSLKHRESTSTDDKLLDFKGVLFVQSCFILINYAQPASINCILWLNIKNILFFIPLTHYPPIHQCHKQIIQLVLE